VDRQECRFACEPAALTVRSFTEQKNIAESVF
jgi:hypothetical protein